MKRKVVYIDIDGTICRAPIINGVPIYEDSEPIQEAIDNLNREYYDKGEIVVYWTARGTTTNRNWFKVTEKQLKSWGVKYHEIRMGKPFYDIFIDDKALNATLFQGRKK